MIENENTAKKINPESIFIHHEKKDSNIELVKLIDKILPLLKEISNLYEKITLEHYEYLKKELEKSLEEIKYKTLLESNLYNIAIKLIEEEKYDEAIKLFTTERDKIREHELKMQKIKNEHEINMEKLKNYNFLKKIQTLLIGIMGGIGISLLLQPNSKKIINEDNMDKK